MTMMFIPMSGTSQGVNTRPKEQKTIRTSHDGSHCTYEVDNPALYANILHRIPISTALIIILLKPDVVWWRNGRPSDCKM
jgi:hypothetical protein